MDEKCPLYVSRELAAQHAFCASCPKFVLNPRGFPNKCNWEGWSNPFEVK